MDVAAISADYPDVNESAKTDAYADTYMSMSSPLSDMQLVYQFRGNICAGYTTGYLHWWDDNGQHIKGPMTISGARRYAKRHGGSFNSTVGVCGCGCGPHKLRAR